MRLVDLTGSFEEGMWRYGPEFPPFEMQSATRFEEEGFAVQKVSISTHMGTHLDAPGHLISGGGLADTIPLDHFIGPAALLRIGDVGPAEMVTRERLQAAADALRPDDIVVVETGWSKHWYDVNFVSDTPHLSLEAAHWLVEQRIRCFVWDAPMFVDPAIDVSGGVPPEQIPDGVILRAGIPMIAPVQNLSAVSSDRFWFVGLPMKIKNADGSPTRCVAIEGWTVE